MKKRLLPLLLILCLLLTGCGASSQTAAPRAANGAKFAMAEEAPMEMEMADEMGLTAGRDAGTAPLPENRKWIVTVYMSAEAEDLDAMSEALNEKIAALGGYVEDQNIYNGSAQSERRFRRANLTIRIPAEAVDGFTEEVAGIANVVSKEKRLEDITLQYVATESRMTALKTEEARLLELLAEAETMADLLEIEARLSDVRCELETVTSQMKIYNNQVDYATIHLSIEEVQEYTPIEEPTFWQRISTGFMGSLKGLGKGAVDLTVWIIAGSPYLVILGGVGAVVVLLIKRGRKKKEVKGHPHE